MRHAEYIEQTDMARAVKLGVRGVPKDLLEGDLAVTGKLDLFVNYSAMEGERAVIAAQPGVPKTGQFRLGVYPGNPERWTGGWVRIGRVTRRGIYHGT